MKRNAYFEFEIFPPHFLLSFKVFGNAFKCDTKPDEYIYIYIYIFHRIFTL